MLSSYIFIVKILEKHWINNKHYNLFLIQDPGFFDFIKDYDVRVSKSFYGHIIIYMEKVLLFK